MSEKNQANESSIDMAKTKEPNSNESDPAEEATDL